MESEDRGHGLLKKSNRKERRREETVNSYAQRDALTLHDVHCGDFATSLLMYQLLKECKLQVRNIEYVSDCKSL